MQHVDHVAHVETFAQPTRHRRSRVQDDSVLLVARVDDSQGIRRQIGRPRNLRDDTAIGSPELKLAVQLAFDLVALLVDRAMVPTTEHGEVRERCRAAVGPVADVMALAEAHAAAREATAMGTILERPSYRRPNRPCPGADAGYTPPCVLAHDDRPPVPGQKLRSSGRDPQAG